MKVQVPLPNFIFPFLQRFLMKAISAVIATVMLLLISVSLISVVYVFSSALAGSSASSSSGQSDLTTRNILAQLSIESVAGNKIQIRNIGTAELTNFSVFIDDTRINISNPELKLKTNELGYLELPAIPSGSKNIKVSEKSASGSYDLRKNEVYAAIIYRGSEPIFKNNVKPENKGWKWLKITDYYNKTNATEINSFFGSLQKYNLVVFDGHGAWNEGTSSIFQANKQNFTDWLKAGGGIFISWNDQIWGDMPSDAKWGTYTNETGTVNDHCSFNGGYDYTLLEPGHQIFNNINKLTDSTFDTYSVWADYEQDDSGYDSIARIVGSSTRSGCGGGTVAHDDAGEMVIKTRSSGAGRIVFTAFWTNDGLSKWYENAFYWAAGN